MHSILRFGGLWGLLKDSSGRLCGIGVSSCYAELISTAPPLMRVKSFTQTYPSHPENLLCVPRCPYGGRAPSRSFSVRAGNLHGQTQV